MNDMIRSIIQLAAGGSGGDNVTVVPYPTPGFGMCAGGAYPNEATLQRALDTQTIIGRLDGISNGLCDGFYAQSAATSGPGRHRHAGLLSGGAGPLPAAGRPDAAALQHGLSVPAAATAIPPCSPPTSRAAAHSGC